MQAVLAWESGWQPLNNDMKWSNRSMTDRSVSDCGFINFCVEATLASEFGQQPLTIPNGIDW